jgi:hypothetical protein
MDDALKAVQQAIENARREGRSEGFAAAVHAMREFLDSVTDKPAPRKSAGILKPDLPKGRVGEASETFVPRIPRFVAKSLIAVAFKDIAPRAAGPTEIQHAVLRKTGTDIPSTTVRRVIDDLVANGRLEAVGDTKTWRLIGDDSGQDETKPESGALRMLPKRSA